MFTSLLKRILPGLMAMLLVQAAAAQPAEVTGQNPSSGKAVAKALLQAIQVNHIQ